MRSKIGRTAAIALRRVGPLLVILTVGSSAFGQAAVSLEFTFMNPGARSTGFGGAFAAVADDATAAFANPSGLVQLVEPEVSIEWRSVSYSTPFTRSGRVSGSPTGVGLDTRRGLIQGTSEVDIHGIAFVSLVLPKEKWSFALHGQQLADFEFKGQTQGLFGRGSQYLGTERAPDDLGDAKLELTTAGVSTAYRWSDTLFVGFGISYVSGELRGHQRTYLWDTDAMESFFGVNSFQPDRLISSNSMILDDSTFTANAGFLWKLAELLRIGGFYRQGPEFDLNIHAMGGPSSPPDELPPGEAIEIPARMAFPDVFGLGAAYRSKDGRLTVSVEWDHIEYSTILETLSASTPQFEDLAADEAIDDANELHVGAEYALVSASLLPSVRVGVWFDPDHRIHTKRDNPFDRATLPRGKDEIHYAVGLGFVYRNLQIDLGADFSDLVDKVSLSAIYTF